MWCSASDCNIFHIFGVRRQAFDPRSITRMCCKFPVLLRWDEEIYRFFSLSLKLPCTVEIAVSSHANYLQHFFLEWALRVTWVNLFWAKFPCFKRCLNSGTSDTMPCFMKDHVSEWRNTHIMTKAFSSLDTKNGFYQINLDTFWALSLSKDVFPNKSGA